MDSDDSDHIAEPVDLASVIGEMETELRCLLGPKISFTSGRLPADGAAVVIHEVPDAAVPDARIRKGRSLGLAASYDTIKRAGGHFHVPCRDRQTVLTICFPLAE